MSDRLFVMDESVKQALAKWPNVPDCTGWLLLDRRGTWRMRDEAAQMAGALGVPIRHPALIAFIARNYAADEAGQWFFQNGPQRVYVELAYTPLIVRLAVQTELAGEPLALVDHLGNPFEPAAVWLDDEGSILFSDALTPVRAALLHDHDLGLFSEHATFANDEKGVLHWRAGVDLPLQPLRRDEAAARFHFVASPAARGHQTD